MAEHGKRFTFTLFLGGWIVAIGLGFWFSAAYEKNASSKGEAPVSWPEEFPLAFDSSRENLILVAHPRCPCTGATLDELIAVMTRCRDRLQVTVLFTVPLKKEAGWDDSDLEQAARRIPGVTVVDDPEGRMAARLGATSSGEVLLFDGRGRLLFSGGITGARGHAGENAGEDAVIALASGRAAGVPVGHAPVFGCALVGPETGRGL